MLWEREKREKVKKNSIFAANCGYKVVLGFCFSTATED